MTFTGGRNWVRSRENTIGFVRRKTGLGEFGFVRRDPHEGLAANSARTANALRGCVCHLPRADSPRGRPSGGEVAYRVGRGFDVRRHHVNRRGVARSARRGRTGRQTASSIPPIMRTFATGAIVSDSLRMPVATISPSGLSNPNGSADEARTGVSSESASRASSMNSGRFIASFDGAGFEDCPAGLSNVTPGASDDVGPLARVSRPGAEGWNSIRNSSNCLLYTSPSPRD